VSEKESVTAKGMTEAGQALLEPQEWGGGGGEYNLQHPTQGADPSKGMSRHPPYCYRQGHV